MNVKKLVLLAIAACVIPAFAKDKSQPIYQEGTLVSFKTVVGGMSCSHTGTSQSNTTGDIDSTGDINGTTKTSANGESVCSNAESVYYTVRSEGHAYVLRPQPRSWNRPSVLNGQPPGSKIELRMSKKGIYVRVSDKESRFDVMEAN